MFMYIYVYTIFHYFSLFFGYIKSSILFTLHTCCCLRLPAANGLIVVSQMCVKIAENQQ